VALTPPPSFRHPRGTFFINPFWTTFFKVQNSNIYPIFRQKVPQNFWNLVIPPPLPPINVQKKVKLEENKTTSKLFGFWLTPPPFGQCPKERLFSFWMSSLISTPPNFSKYKIPLYLLAVRQILGQFWWDHVLRPFRGVDFSRSPCIMVICRAAISRASE
jgi:hypothetical protein